MGPVSARAYRRLQDSLFVATLILLPFQVIPQPVFLQQHFQLLAFPHAAAYPAGLGLLLHLLTAVKRRKRPGGFWTTAYFVLLSGWVALAALWGICKATSGYLTPGISAGTAVYQAVKFGLGPFAVANGIAYWVYAQYRLKWRRGLALATRGLVWSFCLAGAYGIIEAAYLAGSDWARQALTAINPFIYTINVHHGWWPPLLWPGQIRTVTAEPSFFGIYAAVVLPFLASRLYAAKGYNRMGVIALLGWLVFLVFLSKARTAVLLCLGEALVFFAAALYAKKALPLKPVLAGIAFLTAASLAAAHFAVDASSQSHVSSQGALRVIMSLANLQERSNAPRFQVVAAEWEIFLNHPVAGAGPGLSGNYYPAGDYHGEVRTWLSEREAKGAAIPVVNAYVRKLAEWGAVGFLLFAAPAAAIIYAVCGQLRRRPGDYQAMAYLVAFSGGCAGLLSASEIVIPGFPVLLGLGFCLAERRIRLPRPAALKAYMILKAYLARERAAGW